MFLARFRFEAQPSEILKPPPELFLCRRMSTRSAQPR
jgi:hypothetical protein